MFQKLVDEWLSLERNKEADDIGMFEAAILYDFAHWLDTRAATLRAPVISDFQSAVECPNCHTLHKVNRCATCGLDFTQISKPSLGG